MNSQRKKDSRARTSSKSSKSSKRGTIKFRLYVAGESPNSALAISNLNSICEKHFRGHYKLEIVDFLKEPKRALTDGVLVAPALVKLSPPPVCKIVGNLSEKSRVLLALGIKGVRNELK